MVTGTLEPDARLSRHISGVGEESVNTKRHLVLDVVAMLMSMPVMHLRLGRVGDVLIGLAQQLRVCGRGKRSMREDDRNAVVEETKSLEKFWAVGVAPGPAQVVRCHCRDVVLARKGHDVLSVLAVRIGRPVIVGHGGGG